MSTKTSIEWTATVHPDGTVTPGKTWNPVRGCSVISPGCHSCYAMKQAQRFSGPGKAYEGLTKMTERSGAQWTGVVRTVESALLEPLKWRKPSRIFVTSMSDLFHEDVPDAFIDQVFAVMALAPNHTFQVLTKRPARMREYFRCDTRAARVSVEAFKACGETDRERAAKRANAALEKWPLPNVWLGVSVENQHFAKLRIPELIRTPAALRFVSLEPLLENVLLDDGCSSWLSCRSTLTIEEYEAMSPDEQMRNGDCCESFAMSAEPHFRGIDWVIVGGESGPGARPFDLAWARSIVQQCKAAGVPVFVKQLGSNPIVADGRPHVGEFVPVMIRTRASKGGDPIEWPEDLRVRQVPEVRG